MLLTKYRNIFKYPNIEGFLNKPTRGVINNNVNEV